MGEFDTVVPSGDPCVLPLIFSDTLGATQVNQG